MNENNFPEDYVIEIGEYKAYLLKSQKVDW